ncbi:autotransporter outer membrane beta-barrel domain-containing protein [Enterobacteriaceae bacterium 89]|nr:autotransporter outer membrane beta-barrel domain-containing protein [Enterobacteriaceae bacterium 89]
MSHSTTKKSLFTLSALAAVVLQAIACPALAEERESEDKNRLTQSTNSSITLFSSPPVNTGSYAVINNGDTLILSQSDNTGNVWDKFKSITVGDNTNGTLIIDNRQITTTSGSIGNNALGSVTLTNQANWTLEGGNLVLGTNNGSALLTVEKGSQISGIKEFRVGEFYAGAVAKVAIDGPDSSVSSGWIVVGDQGKGHVDITNGGSMTSAKHMNIGYVGNTDTTQRNGYGSVHLDGENSTLNVASGLYLGGFDPAKNNDATGILTASNGAIVNVGSFIWLGTGKGSTGIMNIGGEQDKAAQAAGQVNTRQIYLGETASTGTTAVLNFNHLSDDFVLAAAINGKGTVNHVGQGTTTLTGNNSYYGITDVKNGTLRAGSQNAFSSNSDFNVGTNGILDLGGFDQTINSLVLAGTINTSQTSHSPDESTPANNILTIKGNYHGENGLLIYNAAQKTDDNTSVVNQLYVEGNTSGTTRVSMQEIGSVAVSDLNGMKVVHVEGESNGHFVREGRLAAGVHEYSLQRGPVTEETALARSAVDDSNHWYLTNQTWIAPTDPTEELPPGETPETPPIAPPGVVPKEGVVYRPEVGSYLANRMAANTMFNTRLHDRLGETQYIDPVTGESRVTSMWLRQVGGHMRFRDNTGQMKTQSNRYVAQLGGDIAQWSSDGLDRWHLGLMAGYGNNSSSTQSSVTGYHAKGKVTGYSAGLYATWYANEADKTGLYVDSWALWNWFDNQVNGQQLATEKYDSDGLTASVETGYTFKPGGSVQIQPKAQLTWMDVSANDHYEENGTRIRDTGKGNLQSRLGLRASIEGYSQLDEGKGRMFQPFVEANWIHNTQDFSVAMNEFDANVKGSKNIGELKAGLEARTSKNLHLWGNVAQQIGGDGYSDTQAMLGVKWVF